MSVQFESHLFHKPSSVDTMGDSCPTFRKYCIRGSEFDVFAKYETQKVIGSGAFGVVTSAVNTENNSIVAIKKVVGAFSGYSKCKAALREIKLTRRFNHENIIHLLDIIPPAPNRGFQDLYFVTELMETDLHRVITSPQALSIEHIQCFIYQILRGLKYIHSANIIHRDLKPSNILVNSNCDLKICDFGLSRFEDDEDSPQKTEYVVTRWYRAPEVMLSRQQYTKAIDIWSVGCIIGEMLNRAPLFPGQNYLDQVAIIFDKVGKPSAEELASVTTPRALDFVLSLPAKATQIDFRDLFPRYRNEAGVVGIIDLARQMLEFQASKRPTSEDALRHKSMEDLHNSDDEPVADFVIDLDFEKPIELGSDLSSRDKEIALTDHYRRLIWGEIRDMHPYIDELPPADDIGQLIKNGNNTNTNTNTNTKQSRGLSSNVKPSTASRGFMSPTSTLFASTPQKSTNSRPFSPFSTTRTSVLSPGGIVNGELGSGSSCTTSSTSSSSNSGTGGNSNSGSVSRSNGSHSLSRQSVTANASNDIISEGKGSTIHRELCTESPNMSSSLSASSSSAVHSMSDSPGMGFVGNLNNDFQSVQVKSLQTQTFNNAQTQTGRGKRGHVPPETLLPMSPPTSLPVNKRVRQSGLTPTATSQ